MEKKKRMRTEKDKGYDKTYNSKTIAFSIGYRSENDAMEGERLKAYLAHTGQSANSYIKELIKADLDAKGFVYHGTFTIQRESQTPVENK